MLENVYSLYTIKIRHLSVYPKQKFVEHWAGHIPCINTTSHSLHAHTSMRSTLHFGKRLFYSFCGYIGQCYSCMLHNACFLNITSNVFQLRLLHV